ncbi:MAG: hypothetical protein ACKVQR_13850 [Aquabacterium sp.]
MMLTLSPDQFDLLDELQVRRTAAAMTDALAQAWPTVTQRLTERWPAFVEAAMQQARRHGLSDTTDFGRWVSLWCLWGANFDEKPGFEWAREILADSRRKPAVKLFQLLHRTRAELRAKPAPAAGAAPGPTLASWDAAIARVTQGAGQGRAAAAVFVVDPVVTADLLCDLGVVDLKLSDAADIQEYRPSQGGLVRQPAPPPSPELVHLDQAPPAPLSISALGRKGPGNAAARLNLRIQPLAVCNPMLHPEVRIGNGETVATWKGRDALQFSTPMLPPAEAPGLTGVGHVLPAQDHAIDLASCGLRETGAPFDAARVIAHVYPAVQWMLAVQQAALPEMQWPASSPAEPAKPASLRLERDAVPVAIDAWQMAWAGLPVACRAGWDKVFNAWTRVVTGNPSLTLQMQALCGSAALTWGWRRTGPDVVVGRCEGGIDMMAVAIDVVLAGEIIQGDSRARIRLRAVGKVELKRTILQLAGAGHDGQTLADAMTTFKLPFQLEVDPMVDGSLAMLAAVQGDPDLLGQISGSAGLRPRPDAAGLEWFFTMAIGPSTATMVLTDPIIGATQSKIPLLAAMPLVDWSAG